MLKKYLMDFCYYYFMDFRELSDEQVVDSCRENPENFGILVRRYEKFLVNFLLKNYKFSKDDAEDLVQEALTKAYLNLSNFDFNRKWKPWIFQITINCAKSFSRKQQVLCIDDFKSILSFENGNAESVFLDKIKQAFSRLTLFHQRLLNMHLLKNYSIQEISRQQKIPSAVVKAGIERAKRNLVIKYYLKIEQEQG